MRTISSIVYSLIALVAISVTVPGHAQDREMSGMGLTVYTDAEFRGAITTFRHDEPDLERIGLNDMISSLRVGPGERWEVCEDAYYRGRCAVIAGDERDLLRVSWNDRISSLRRVDGQAVPPGEGTAAPYVPPPVPGAGSQRGWSVILYDQPNYRGRAVNVRRAVPNTTRRVRSVTIGRGTWEFCDRANYKGRCKTVDNSVPDVRVLNLRGRVVSLRPVPRARPVPPAPSGVALILFKLPDYRGAATTIGGAVANLSENDSRAQSADIEGGDWQLCEGSNFSGRCVTLERSAPDLNAYGLGNRVRSVRPVRRDPGEPDAGTPGLAGKRWVLAEMQGRRFNSEALYIEFDRDRVSGSSGCNRFTGAFEADRARLTFAPIAGTRRACTDPDMQRAENAFLDLLPSTTRYEVRGNMLRLYSN
ncbi:MAG TPA: beta/gamma crystallin-related protein, partial [Telluria sp.]|nr:beta/gamma crystallin-related protein [Telluria sp.]